MRKAAMLPIETKRPQARSLCLGIMLNQGCGHYMRMADGIMEYATGSARFHTIIMDSSQLPGEIPELIGELSGMIGDAVHLPWWKFLSERRIPFVFISEKSAVRSHPCVLPDSTAIGRMAGDFWLERQPASIAFLGFQEALYSQKRGAAFAARVGEAGQRVVMLPAMRLKPRLSTAAFAGYRKELAARLKALPKPCGLYAANDYLATLAIEVAVHAGVLVPEELGVLGTDNDRRAIARSLVPFSSIDLNSERIGWEAAALLDRLLQRKQGSEPQLFFPPQGVVERASTGRWEKQEPLLERARAFMLEHLAESFTVADLARHCQVSRRQLETRFRESMNLSPGGQLRQLRLAEAKRLLRETDLTLEWVAEKCGFASRTFFARHFKVAFGQTPSEYRRQHHLAKPH